MTLETLEGQREVERSDKCTDVMKKVRSEDICCLHMSPMLPMYTNRLLGL